MHILKDEYDGDFYLSNWENLKRVKEEKRSHGRTHRILMDHHRKQFNRSHLMSYDIYPRERFIEERERTQLENEVSFMNIDNPKRKKWEIYSLNKRKRWLLTDMFEKKVREGEPDDDYRLEVYYHFMMVGRYQDRLSRYIDSQGTDLTNRSGVKINANSLITTRDNIENMRHQMRKLQKERRRNKKKVNLEKYQRQRKVYKNGNRNRNSGIKRRNQTFIQDNQAVENPTKNRILVSFRTPEPIYENRWPQTNHKKFSIREKYYKYLSNYNYYASRIFKKLRGYFWNKYLRSMINILKVKSVNDRRLDIIKRKAEYEQMKTQKIISKSKNRLEQEDYEGLNIRSKKYDLSELIITNNKKIKEKNKQKIKIDEFPPNKIVYIDKEESDESENEEEDIEIVPTKQENTNGLIDIKASLSNSLSFFDSIQNLLEIKSIASLIYECEPKLVLFKIDNLGSIVFKHDNNIINDQFEFTLNPHVNRSKINHLRESLEIKLNERKFESIQDLIEIIKSHVEEYSLEPSLIKTRAKIDHSLIGLKTSREFRTIVKEIKEEFSIREEVNDINISNESTFLTCPICFDDANSVGMIRLNKCGHWACRPCWQSYLNTRLADFTTSHRIECLYEKCESTLSENLLLTLVSESLVDSYFKSYSRIRLLKSGGQYRFCSSINCDGVIQLKSNGDNWPSTLRCSCGISICRLCLAEGHYPASCAQAKRYREELRANNTAKTTDEDLYESEGKNCPACNIYYEKNGGCNFMSCPCGMYFCWE